MKPTRDLIIVGSLLAAVAVIAAGCGLPPVFQTSGGWTPSALTPVELGAVEAAASDTPAAPEEPSSTPTSLPTSSPTATLEKPAATATGLTVAAASTLTRTPTRRPTATVPRATKSPTPKPSPTVDRHRVVITEADIVKGLGGEAAAQQGLKANNLKVRFANGKVNITADQLSYGAINVRNLALVGRLIARNGKLELVPESVSPGGLIGALIPRAANQALGQLAANAYVEEVQTLDGRVELRVR